MKTSSMTEQQIMSSVLTQLKKLSSERDAIAVNYYKLTEKEKREILPKLVKLNEQILILQNAITPSQEQLFDFLLECFYAATRDEGRHYWDSIPENEKDYVVEDVLSLYRSKKL